MMILAILHFNQAGIHKRRKNLAYELLMPKFYEIMENQFYFVNCFRIQNSFSGTSEFIKPEYKGLSTM